VKTILKFKYGWPPRYNNFFSFALLAMVACTGLISIGVHAYDGDVDYMAPYLTVDPETGKLVTIDPRAETKTVHEASTDSTAQIPSTTVDAPPTQTAPVSAQTVQDNPSIPATTQAGSAPGANLPLIAGMIIGLLAISFIFYSKRKKPVSESEADSANS
jgi:hypothetical protein